MSRRKKKIGLTNRTIAIVATVLIHALIIGALLFNYTSKPKYTEASFPEKVDVVKATVVDEKDIERQKEKLRQKDKDKKRLQDQEKKQLEDLKKQTEKEKQNIEDLKKKQVEEKKKAEKLVAQRKAIALKKKKEEAKRKKEAAARNKKQAAEKKRRAAEAAEKERLLNEALAAEEELQAEQRAIERATTLVSKYTALIYNEVSDRWTISPDYTPGLEAYINVRLSAYGDVKSVQILRSSGNPSFDRSVESAILKATPLPIPSVAEDPDVNKLFQNLNLTFNPGDLQ